MAEELVLEVKDIEKSFPGTKALSKVNFQLRKGEIHAVVGENGAGKSTLMNVIDGVYTPDAGEIYINGRKVEIKDPWPPSSWASVLSTRKLRFARMSPLLKICTWHRSIPARHCW